MSIKNIRKKGLLRVNVMMTLSLLWFKKMDVCFSIFMVGRIYIYTFQKDIKSTHDRKIFNFLSY